MYSGEAYCNAQLGIYNRSKGLPCCACPLAVLAGHNVVACDPVPAGAALMA
jgi:hypothetical protein